MGKSGGYKLENIGAGHAARYSKNCARLGGFVKT
jgi:hypothetical protein